MAKEIININPKLSPSHKEKFLDFCRVIKRQLRNKTILQREEILILKKDEIYKKYRGRNFHNNTDLAFIQSLVIDLLLQDWNISIRKGEALLELETLDGNINVDEEKAKTRRRQLLGRDAQLRQPSVSFFIQNMERKRLTEKGWHSIFSLMRDGEDLAKQLKAIEELNSEEEKLSALRQTVKPYIQFAEPYEKCQQTGFFLTDIWRYFRHTWVNEYKSLPGRSISILIRDAAAPNHPVIGIAALGSSAAQQTCRDEWIGWEGKTFLQRLQSDPSAKYGRWIINTLDSLLKELYLKDFIEEGIITKNDLRNPSAEILKELRSLAIEYKGEHIENPHTAKFSATNQDLSWADRAKTNLFKSKRATVLAELLSIKQMLNKYQFKTGSKGELTKCLNHAEFRFAIEKLVRKAKSARVGINMMDIIVCGSIAPYNHILGGKLVCMLLASPEVSNYYNRKYQSYISLIASSMRGKAVVRKPDLVLLGTTSLYGAGSSQYNRIKIPCDEIGGKPGTYVEYRELGYSEGFGSFHFSSTTIELANAVVGRIKGKKRVNSIFGEGANPLLRKLKDAMEFFNLESHPILNHRNKRVVYGIALCENFFEVLVGLSNKAAYKIPHTKAKQRTELIANFWIKRWLKNRILREDTMQQVNQHSLSYPITHGGRVPIKKEEELTLF